MSDFDLLALRNFRPPRFFCRSCAAIYTDLNRWNIEIKYNDNQVLYGSTTCPSCTHHYGVTLDYDHEAHARERFEEYQIIPTLANTVDFQHARDLASLAIGFTVGSLGNNPMNTVFRALNLAKNFVNFISTGYSHQMLGAMKMAGLRGLRLRGIISGVSQSLEDEIVKSQKNFEMQNISLVRFSEIQANHDEVPHTKIIVVDGILAFKGGMNLSLSGMRKAAKNLDIFEPVTQINEVMKLNNTYFSPLWNKHHDDMDDIPF